MAVKTLKTRLRKYRLLKSVWQNSVDTANMVKIIGKQKIFCIGQNKTGTTSLTKALHDLGITVGRETPAHLLLYDWARRDFRRIIRFCHTAQAFQDIPFSLPYTFQAMDMAFPNSKFILTIRDSSEQWFESLLKHHRVKFGRGNLPSNDELRRLPSISKVGSRYDQMRLIFGVMENSYDKDRLIGHHEFHNQSVIEYFRHRPDDLLVINVAEKGSYAKLCAFLGKEPVKDEFPWLNRSANYGNKNLQ